MYFTQIDDMETLRFAREADLLMAGLKIGDVIKIRISLRAIEQNSIDLNDSGIDLESTSQSASGNSTSSAAIARDVTEEEVRSFPLKFKHILA